MGGDNRLDDVFGQFAVFDDAGLGDFKYSGTLRHDESGRLSFGAVEPDALGVPLLTTQGAARPQALIGYTERGGVVLTNLSKEDASHSIGGSKVSTRRFEAATAASSVNLYEFEGLKVPSAAAVFSDGLPWAGLRAITEKRQPSVGRLKRVDLEIESRGGPLSATLTKSRNLRLDAHWKVAPSTHGHEIETGLHVEVTAVRPRALEEMLQPILQIQDLLAVIHRRPILAIDAMIKFKGMTENSTLWDWRLCEAAAHDGLREVRETVRPRLAIKSMGGTAGVARWVALCESHPRAVSPLRHERVGTGNVISLLVDTAIAIEYWVGIHRRTTKWAKHTSQGGKGSNYAMALAMHAGKPFAAFCDGRPADWANEFWATYNQLKHDPAAPVDPRRINILAWSGMMLLECALLDWCARSRKASSALVQDRYGKDLAAAVATIL